MREEGHAVSITRLCRWFGVPRSSFYYEPTGRRPVIVDQALVVEIRKVIDASPTYGVRRITAVIRRLLKAAINRKRVHRIIKLNGWQVSQKPRGQRPRAKGWISRAERPNQRWAIDATHVFCGKDGWCHLTAIIDCCDREIVGWRLSKSGVSKIAAAALEDALRARSIWPESGLLLRSDNGLVFGSKVFVKVVKRYGLDQEYITPYTPEQNGMIERFFKTLKEECVWAQRFADRDHAFEVIANWMDHYHTGRPHSALGYLTPAEYRLQLAA